MPNWVRNRLFFDDPHSKEIADEYIVRDANGNYNFSLNKIIPMPEELDIEYGSRSDDGLKLYFTKIEKELQKEEVERKLKLVEPNIIYNDRSEIFLSDEKVSELKEKYGDDFEKIEELGKKQIDNVEKYGYLNWYKFCVDKWGCKWDGSNTTYDGKVITFDTPWSPPIPAIKALAERHPNLRIGLIYSDECLGNGVGYYLMDKGKLYQEGMFPDQSKWAMEFAIDLWDRKDDFRFDHNLDNFVFKKKRHHHENEKPRNEMEAC